MTTTLPAGWKLVPIEPTAEMWAAVNKLDDEMAAGAYDGKGASIEQVWNCLVDAAPGAPAVDGWLDIATAPKTGRTLLLGYWNLLGKWRTVRGQWMSAEYIGQEWEEPDDVEAGWFEIAVEADDMPNCWRVTPSHWMPLPAAPTPPATTQDDTLARTGNTADHQEGWYAGVDHGRAEARASAQDDAKDEQAAFEDWMERTCPSGDVESVQRQWEASSDFADFHAPAAGDAMDAQRWRSFRRAITQRDEDWLNRMDSALTAMGLDPEGDELPSDDQVDTAADLARQGDGGA